MKQTETKPVVEEGKEGKREGLRWRKRRGDVLGILCVKMEIMSTVDTGPASSGLTVSAKEP